MNGQHFKTAVKEKEEHIEIGNGGNCSTDNGGFSTNLFSEGGFANCRSEGRLCYAVHLLALRFSINDGL